MAGGRRLLLVWQMTIKDTYKFTKERKGDELKSMMMTWQSSNLYTSAAERTHGQAKLIPLS
jgi:hypothetical protein